MTRTQLLFARLIALFVISASAWNSYWHIVHVAKKYGQDDMSAYLLSFSVDGLMLAASIFLTKATGWAKWLYRGVVLFGLAVSVTCNMMATAPGIMSRGISAVYAFSMFLGIEMFIRSFHGVAKRLSKKEQAAKDAADAQLAAEAAAKAAADKAEADRVAALEAAAKQAELDRQIALQQQLAQLAALQAEQAEAAQRRSEAAQRGVATARANREAAKQAPAKPGKKTAPKAVALPTTEFVPTVEAAIGAPVNGHHNAA